MKQGRASSNTQTGAKMEPKPRAMNPAAVNQLGNHVGTKRAVEKMHVGKGFKSSAVPTLGKGNQGPGAHRTVRKSGTQKCHD